MAKPPPATPSSDVDGVNRDGSAGAPSKDGAHDPGGQLDHARDEAKARPEQSGPQRKGG